MNIILVAGASGRGADDHAGLAALDRWAASRSCVVFVAFTFAFNFVTLQVGGGRSSIRGCRRSCSPTSARKRSGRRSACRGISTRWRCGWASCRRRCCGSTALGERLAKRRGLKPQELPSLGAGAGRGGARRRRCRRATCRSASSRRCSTRSRARSRTRDRPARRARGAARRTTRRNRKFLPTLLPIVDGWYSSNFGYRIDPFTGQQSFHEGIDFPAEAGTPIVAAASGKVVFADWHPAVW